MTASSHSRLAPRRRFLSRVATAAAWAFALIVGTLAVGTVGYRQFDDLAWLDAFHQSALLLAGMGPVETMTSAGGKLFDSIYALFCAVMLLGAAGVLFTPVIHRLLHRFHLEDAGGDQ